MKANAWVEAVFPFTMLLCECVGSIRSFNVAYSLLLFHQVDGFLRFSIYYEEPRSQLVITVLQAKVLLENHLQAFVKIILMQPTPKTVKIKKSVHKKVSI